MSDNLNNQDETYKLHGIRSIYFFCEPQVDLLQNPNANTDYQHCIISLAEGLTALGYACYGNVDYWQSNVDSPYLIKKTPNATIAQCSAVVISSHWFVKNECPEIPTSLPMFLMADMQANAHIILQYPFLSVFEKILYCGYVRHYRYPSNVVPWAFGLTNRIIKAVEDATTNLQPNLERNQNLLVNFRMGHTSRELAEKYLLPSMSSLFTMDSNINDLNLTDSYDRLMSEQTGRRHYPSYYQTLCTTRAVATYGGYFASSFSHNRFSLINKITFFIIRKLGLTSKVLVQHDSWRFWETLVAGALAFHVDFEECGVEYPENPINGKHYIGISRHFFAKHNPNDLFEKLKDCNFDTIAREGKYFVLKHYHPVSVAKRFLKYL